MVRRHSFAFRFSVPLRLLSGALVASEIFIYSSERSTRKLFSKDNLVIMLCCSSMGFDLKKEPNDF